MLPRSTATGATGGHAGVTSNTPLRSRPEAGTAPTGRCPRERSLGIALASMNRIHSLGTRASHVQRAAGHRPARRAIASTAEYELIGAAEPNGCYGVGGADGVLQPRRPSNP